jgi:hypothetical protein
MAIEFTLRQQQVVKDEAFVVINEVTSVSGVTAGLAGNLSRVFLVSRDQSREVLFRVCTANDYLIYDHNAQTADFYDLRSIYSTAFSLPEVVPSGQGGGKQPVILYFDVSAAPMDVWLTEHTQNYPSSLTPPSGNSMITSPYFKIRVIAGDFQHYSTTIPVTSPPEAQIAYVESGVQYPNIEFPSAIFGGGVGLPFSVYSDTNPSGPILVGGVPLVGTGYPLRHKEVTGTVLATAEQLSAGLLRTNKTYQYFSTAEEMSNAALAVQTQITSLAKEINIVSEDLDILFESTYGA